MKYLKLLTDTSTTPKYPLDGRVCNTETQCHLLPVQAEQVVSHQYLGLAEMTHKLSGYQESQGLDENVVSPGETCSATASGSVISTVATQTNQLFRAKRSSTAARP